MGEVNTVPMRINGVEGAAGQVKTSGGAGVLETWTTPVNAAGAVAAVEAAGLALASGKNIKLIANLTGDHSWSGLTGVLQAGENLTIGQLAYVKNDGKMWKAVASAASTAVPCIALATGTINADAWGEFLLIGFFRDDSITFTLGDILYVSDTVAGAFDNVAPADTTEMVQRVGICIVGTHIVYFKPDLTVCEVA